MQSMSKRLDSRDFAGQKFGRLTVVGEGARAPSYWIFRCDCGASAEYRRDAVFRGNTTSCGCAHRDIMKARIKHGHSRVGKISPEFQAYRGMMGRCYNPGNSRYPLYGGRGIVVCDRWKGNFPVFYEDIGPKPSPKHSLDRINNDGNYSPDNCRWATPSEQARNRSTNRLVVLDQRRITVAEASERLGIPYNRLHKQLPRP